tara:strand:+ start:30 stop:503 length:474 start_codon:yes stop_codon:yes gene_type:complete
MSNNYISIYNNLIHLTRNKLLFSKIGDSETFSYRLILFLIHFAFFLKIFKQNNNKNILQEIYDFNFKQVELSIREIGYGDVSINKKMKDYLNFFHDVVGKVNNWDNMNINEKSQFFQNFINDNTDTKFFIDYFEKYVELLKKSTLNSFSKDILEVKI